MTVSEFETHTGMYPDALLYRAACAEYEAKTDNGDHVWDSKAQFCHAYKFNEDGLAERVQAAANAKYTEMEDEIVRLRSELKPLADRCEKLAADNNRLEDDNENICSTNIKLTETIHELAKRVDELTKEVEEMPSAELDSTEYDTLTDIKAQMMDALIDAACRESTSDEILHMVFGYDYLIRKMDQGGDA